MEYENHNLKIISDFPIKVIREDKNEVDLIINLDYRCLNLNLPEKNIINSRIQFTLVKSIMIRFCKGNSNNIATIHFMKDSGLHSTMANFEVNYLDKKIIIKQEDNSVEMFME
ncbi:hypothetical protein [Hathewaya massiliensis]|uniref:hypothetical protein n=1 Tax=Hathewaya massiliensis TaxID=1964382 RepID=UPI00115BAE10|nr:hypothetical protein [Hathewaya massiliensis]